MLMWEQIHPLLFVFISGGAEYKDSGEYSCAVSGTPDAERQYKTLSIISKYTKLSIPIAINMYTLNMILKMFPAHCMELLSMKGQTAGSIWHL